MPLELDLNHPTFQRQLVALEKLEVLDVIRTLRKLMQLEWSQLYADQGLKWEYIPSRDFFTLRASQRMRIAARREGNILRLLSIHPDHDSAYE